MTPLLAAIAICLQQDSTQQSPKDSKPEASANTRLEEAQNEFLDAVRQIDGALVLEALPFLRTDVNDAAGMKYSVQSEIVYSTVGKRKVLLDAYVPDKKGTYPAVLVVHGGAWATGNRKQLAVYARRLAKMGMVCFAIDYRLAPKYKWPAQIDDCRAAVKWIREHAKEYKVDASRLGAIGYSAGGHLVALLGTTGEAPSSKNNGVDTRLQAVVAGGAPVEFFRASQENSKWLSPLMGGDMQSAPEKYRSATAGAFIDKDDPPFFFYNGTMDLLVPLKWTKPLHDELKKHGVRSEMHTVEGAGHALAAMNGPALQKAFAFLKRELSKEPKAEATNKDSN